MLTVFHTSDYQVGRPYLPEAADANRPSTAGADAATIGDASVPSTRETAASPGGADRATISP